VKEDGRYTSKAVYTLLGLNINGKKEILGLHLSENEGANYWLTVLTDLNNRVVKDILIAYTDKMHIKIDSRIGRRQYSKRLGMIEPLFGNITANKGLNKFTLRGQDKVNAQWQLYCLVHNREVKKLSSLIETIFMVVSHHIYAFYCLKVIFINK
jgi:hypothetical protein